VNRAIREALDGWRAAEARSMKPGLDMQQRFEADAEIERHRQAFMIACGQAVEHDVLGLISELRDAELARGSADPSTPAYHSAASREDSLARTISLSVSAETSEANRGAAPEPASASSRSRKTEGRAVASPRKTQAAQSH
jgi:hypothetical protein